MRNKPRPIPTRYPMHQIGSVFRRSAERLNRVSTSAHNPTDAKKTANLRPMDSKKPDAPRGEWYISLSLLDLIFADGQRPLLLGVMDLSTRQALSTRPPDPKRGGVVAELGRLLRQHVKPERIRLDVSLGLADEAIAIQHWADHHQIPICFGTC